MINSSDEHGITEYREALRSVIGHATKFLIHVLGQQIFKEMRKPIFSEREPRLLGAFLVREKAYGTLIKINSIYSFKILY